MATVGVKGLTEDFCAWKTWIFGCKVCTVGCGCSGEQHRRVCSTHLLC